jgi:hypothetical protein
LTRIAVAATLFNVAPGQAFAQDRDALRYFKNYFVTGDYTVAGVGLRGKGVGGWATDTINMNSVPEGADVVAAFLYWQTVEVTPAPSLTNGFFRGRAIVGLALGDPKNPACWSSGGTVGPSNAAGRVYRADVLRYLPVDASRNVRIANGAHTVRLPDSGGTGNGSVPFTNGATLVVVYRLVVPGNPAAVPFRSVVIYDGAYSMDKRTDDFSQRIAGFYQAAPSANARVTALVGNGAPGSSTEWEVNDTYLPKNAFVGARGPRWDNPTYSFPLAANASSFKIGAEPDNNQTCLTFAAFVASTAVVDTDRDGLLDLWETRGLVWNPGTASTPARFGTCADFPNEPCVNLPAMGAVNGQRDIFLEMDWMEGANDNRPGSHSHRPKLEALTRVANAFKQRNIRVHFDVGNNFQNLATGPDFTVVPAAHAQGGEVIQESTLLCPNPRTPLSACAYATPYSVLSYKKGFASVRDGNAPLGLPRRFARNRKDIYHYVLWGHAFAGPVDPVTGRPLGPEPRSYSGAADRPGGDILITLGLWRSNLPENDQVGSALVQAGTLMHELGHNLGLSHAGVARTPNCMPNYASVMNYLYQSRGLSPVNGADKVIDFSTGMLPALNENSLTETPTVFPPYKVRYYGPVTANDPPGSAVQLRCDGSAITDGARMIRLENDFSNFVDWDHNLQITPGLLRQDINFSGTVGDGANGGTSLLDHNDWSAVNLQQISSRLNVGGLSTDVGVSDLGVSDLGVSELGAVELGVSELGVSDLGVSDLGAIELGAVELGELDYDTAVLSSVDPPPPASTTCPTCGLRATNLIDRIRLNWTAPETGSVMTYNVYRSLTGTPGSFVFLRSLPGGAPALTVDDIADGTTTRFNTTYVYHVTSMVRVNSSLVESLPSNQASGIVKRIFVAGVTASRFYLDPNPVLFTLSGLDQPPPAGVACITDATQTSNAGQYPIVCTGPATTPNPVNGITYINGLLTVLPRPQAITFAALPNRPLSDGSFTVSALATSGLPVGFSASGACTVSGTTVTLTTTGNCSVTAIQPGNLNYQPAPSVLQSFTILPSVGFNFANFNSTTGLTLNGDSTTVNGALRLSSVTGQTSATWYTQPLPVASGFSTTFQFRATPVSNPPADGFAFVIQTGSAAAIGGGGSSRGGAIGYDGIPGSLAVEFDTHFNQLDFNDPNANHVAVQSNGAAANSSTHGPATLAINSALDFTIADGALHTVTITYVPGMLSVSVDGRPVLTAPVQLNTLLALPPNGQARVGLTSATGALAQISDILSWSFQVTN